MLNVEGTAGQRKHSHAAAMLAVVTAMMHHASDGRGGDFATMPNGPQSTTTIKHVEADHERESGGGEKEWEDPEESESQSQAHSSHRLHSSTSSDFAARDGTGARLLPGTPRPPGTRKKSLAGTVSACTVLGPTGNSDYAIPFRRSGGTKCTVMIDQFDAN